MPSGAGLAELVLTIKADIIMKAIFEATKRVIRKIRNFLLWLYMARTRTTSRSSTDARANSTGHGVDLARNLQTWGDTSYAIGINTRIESNGGTI